MGSALRIGSPLTSPTSKMIQQMASVRTFHLCLVLGLVTIQQAQAQTQAQAQAKALALDQCATDCATKFPEEDPEKCTGLTSGPQEGTNECINAIECINECVLSTLDGLVPPADLCAYDCVLKFNSEQDPEKCVGKNFLEKGTCDHCLKECEHTELGHDPSTRCKFDCLFKFNPEQDEDKCLVQSGPCFKCMKDCHESNKGARRSLSVTIFVISFFVALMW